MEPWYSGAVGDAVREARTRRAVFIVYTRDDGEQSQLTDQLWSTCWTKFPDTDRIVALRLDKDTEASKQFMAIYKVQNYPTIYFINGQNGQVLTLIDQPVTTSEQLEENLRDALKRIDSPAPAPAPTPVAEPSTTKSVEERVADARARLKELQDKREEEAKEKERQDEIERRRLGQKMLSDKQKKEEELIRQRAEEFRRDKLEQQKLQEKLKLQIQQDREEKRRKYEGEQSQSSASATQPKTSVEPEKVKVNYTRSRLQFRLTDGSFFTEDFSCDAHMNDVYNYLQETLPNPPYNRGQYLLRTTHTRVTLTQDDPKTLNELELVPSAVLLVIPRGNAPSSVATPSSFSWIFTWFMMQVTILYQYLSRTLFGARPTPATRTMPTNQTNRPKENFRTDPTESTTIRRFRNTQDDKDDDDEEKRTWNGNSTEQL